MALDRIEAYPATDPDLVAGGPRLRALPTACRNGGYPGGFADRYWPLHAGGVLSTGSSSCLADDPAFYDRFSRVFVPASDCLISP